MPTLSVNHVIRGIQQGRLASSVPVDLDVLDAYVERALAEKLALSTASTETRQLFEHLEAPLTFVSPQRRAALADCDVFVLPFPLCVSYAHELAGRPLIVLSTGLIDLIANAIFASQLQSLLPQALETYYLLQARHDMPASDLVANALFLQLHAFRGCAPLPNCQALLSPQLLRQSQDAIDGALLFIVLHELGHHRLGHLDSDRIRPLRYRLIVGDALSIDQQQELEADQFALDSLIEPAQAIGTFWHQNAVNFFMQLELVSGQLSGTDHPAAIDRAFHADALRAQMGKDLDVHPRRAFFDTLAARYRATQRHAHEPDNALIHTSRAGCLDILKQSNRVLADFGIDLSPVWETPAPGWLDTRVS